MQVNVTARHLELTPSLASYVQKKVEKCQRYFDNVVWAQVILSVEKYRQVAELVLHAGKNTFRAQVESTDLYAAIDLMVDKMDKQLKKYKEMSKVNRKAKKGTRPRTLAGRKKAAEEEIIVSPELSKHGLSEIRHFNVKPYSVREAIDELELLGYKFYVFYNAELSQLSVVYKRDNGSYGLIVPLT